MSFYQIGLPQITAMGGFNDFRNESFFVWDEVNDHLDCSLCDYRASSWLIQKHESRENAILIAAELLSLLLGYMKMVDSNVSLHLEKNGIVILKNNQIESFNFDEVQIPNFLLSNIWNQQKNHKPHNIKEITNLKTCTFDALLYMATTDNDIYILLKLLAEKTSWYSLYKIYESLETFTTLWSYPHLKTIKKGKESIQVLDIESEKEKLTKPANNFSIVGLEARHGYKKHSKPITLSNCFTLNQAKDFVYNHVKNYMKWRISEFRTSSLFNQP